MRFKLFALFVVLSCLPAAAQPLGPRLQIIQGAGVTVGGRAHIWRAAGGAFIEIENPGLTRSIAGFLSFGDAPTFAVLSELEGRSVEITGPVILDGGALILMTDPNQLRVKASD